MRIATLTPILAMTAFGLTACGVTAVDFECLETDPLCRLQEELNDVPVATGIDITDVVLTQGVAKVLMQDGALASDDLTVVADRDAIFRIGVSPHADFESRALKARVVLTVGGETIDAASAEMTVSGASDMDNLDSTFNVRISGPSLGGEMEWAVELVEIEEDAKYGGEAGVHTFPTDGSAPLSVTDTGIMRIYFVPVRYKNGLPVMTDEQMNSYAEMMKDQNPTSEIEIVIGDEYDPGNINLQNFNDWSTLLNNIGRLRQDRPEIEEDQYIYGAFDADTGGLLGLCNLGMSPNDSWSRACIGVGYSGYWAWSTMIHEVGHAQGRNHSPCGGADSPEPDYPHSNAVIGVRGYDISDDILVMPNSNYDYMSYCDPTWVSDFTWDATATRIGAVNDLYQAKTEPVEYATWWQYPDGSVERQEDQTVRGSLAGPTRRVQIEANFLPLEEDAYFTGLDHLPGGLIRVPLKGRNIGELTLLD